MAKRPPNDGASWSAGELRTLKALAKAGTPTGEVAKKLGRTAAAVQQKKKDEFAKRCSKPVKSPLELEDCKAVYRQM